MSVPTRLSDEELAALFQAHGSREAMEELVRRYSPPLRRLIFTLAGPDAELALEAEQEVFVTLIRKLGHFRGDSRFATFFYRIARNRIADLLKSERRRTLRSSPLRDEDPPDCTRSPEELALRGCDVTLLRQALSVLSPEDRMLLYLKEGEGVGVAELAVLAQMKEGTVKSRLARARKRVARRLEEMGYEQ